MSCILSLLRRLRKIFYKIFPFKTVGVRALVLNAKQDVLLVQHTYLPGWYLPGGGVGFDESPLAALKRELKEEVDLELEDNCSLFAVYLNQQEGINDFVILYLIKSYKGQVQIKDKKEIADMGWFSLQDLPQTLSPGTRRRLQEFKENQMPSERW